MRPAGIRFAYPRKGMTLVEILLVGAILIVIMGVVLVVMLNHQASYLSMDASIQVSEEARRALDFMTRELRGACGTISASLPSDYASSLEFQVPLGYNVPGCVVNAICPGAFDANGTAQQNWKVRYAVTGAVGSGQLIREVRDAANGVQATRVLATKIDGAGNRTFFEYSAVNNQITLHLSVITPNSPLIPAGQRSSGVITSQVQLRNE